MKTDTRSGLVAAGLLSLAVLAAGCGGGSTTEATSSKSSPSTPTSVALPSTPSSRPKPAEGSPSADQLSAVKQDLDQAGSSLAGSESAINGSDVNQAKAQEGSAP